MVAKDTIIGVVGAAILLAALTGVFYYEGSSAEGSSGDVEWTVTWTTEVEDGPQAEAYTNEGDTTTETLEVTQANITEVEVALSWEDDVGEPDRFRLAVTSPTGETQEIEGEGTSETINVTFADVNEAPPETTVVAADEQAALAQLAEQYTKTLGQGEWDAEVECLEAGDSDPLGAGAPVEEDEGNDWTLSISLEVYEPELEGT